MRCVRDEALYKYTFTLPYLTLLLAWQVADFEPLYRATLSCQPMYYTADCKARFLKGEGQFGAKFHLSMIASLSVRRSPITHCIFLSA